MSEEIKIGVYKHFKEGFYEVLGESTHTKTWEVTVIYSSYITLKIFLGGKFGIVQKKTFWRKFLWRENWFRDSNIWEEKRND